MVSFLYIILPRDAMHKGGLCRRAVSVHPSCCVSFKTSKHILKLFGSRIATPF